VLWSADWLKIKSRAQQEFVACGFTEGKGSRKHFGALLLAATEAGDSAYLGHSGTGFSERGLEETIDRHHSKVVEGDGLAPPTPEAYRSTSRAFKLG
jgi:bifunctional non-homologous end joining protein LigD